MRMKRCSQNWVHADGRIWSSVTTGSRTKRASQHTDNEVCGSLGKIVKRRLRISTNAVDVCSLLCCQSFLKCSHNLVYGSSRATGQHGHGRQHSHVSTLPVVLRLLHRCIVLLHSPERVIVLLQIGIIELDCLEFCGGGNRRNLNLLMIPNGIRALHCLYCQATRQPLQTRQ